MRSSAGFNRSLAGVCGVMLFAAALVCFGCSGDAMREENARLRSENESLHKERTLLLARIEDLIRAKPGLSAAEREDFRKSGLRNPQDDLIADLGSREDLMPLEGVFGARPSFYREVRLYILNGKWAYASWDMGGRLGQRLFEYTVSGSGEIRWKVIDTWIR